MIARPTLRLVPGRHEAREHTGTPTPPAHLADAHDAAAIRLIVAALCGFGLVMVLASSSVASIADYGSPFSLFERQAMWTLIGLVVFSLTSRLSLELVRRFVRPALFGATALLLVVLVPHLGTSSGGSSRWIGVGMITIQPSELMKIVFAVLLADLVARREASPNQWQAMVRPIGVLLGIIDILIIKQPDMGTAVVLVCMSIGVLLAAGVAHRLLLACTLVLALVGGALALAAPYRRDRLFSFLNPFGHASTTGYQVVQSLVALGSGHVGGSGIGSSPAIWGWLPNAQSDFVFAVIGNELGLVGSVAVVVLFAAFGFIGVRVAARATDRFSSLLATAITCWIVAQAMINIGGVVGALPETGIPLPFISSGGSALVVALGACGLLVNIARRGDRSRNEAGLGRVPTRSNPSRTTPVGVAPAARRARNDARARGSSAGRPVRPARSARSRSRSAGRPSTRATTTRAARRDEVRVDPRGISPRRRSPVALEHERRRGEAARSTPATTGRRRRGGPGVRRRDEADLVTDRSR